MTESPLDRLLRLAASVSLLEPTALGEVDKSGDEGDVHEHLMRECPWYKAVSAGEGATDPGKHCKGGHCGEGHLGALIKFTPHTGEASTVDKPTVPPGGPGLFHVKGLHLPPYFQHLYPHLVARYGKQGAYKVAVGVVKKWAAGVNPGGKHPTKTHPDVKAAASKNIAQWEEDKAKAHKQSASHVKAAAPQPSPMEGGTVKLLPLPPPPKKTAAMMTAHRVNDMRLSLAHAIERMDAACKTKDPEIRKYEAVHIRNHLARTINGGHLLADNLRRNYPAEGRELDATMKTLGLAKALSPAMMSATTAHLLETILNECTHASRHAQFLSKPEPFAEWDFNARHVSDHLNGALKHAVKLSEHIMDNYPAEAKLLAELESLGTTIKAAAPLPVTVDLPTPQELRKFASEIKKMTDDADYHLRGAQLHLESAAEQMVTNPVNALMSLRSAQTAIQQVWRRRVQLAVPSAGQSSQQQAWAKVQAQIGEIQGVAAKISWFINRVRRAYYGRMGLESSTDGGGLAGLHSAHP